MSVELIGADYHRNGVGGAGFFVALFTDTENNPGRTFIATLFVDDICPKCKGSGEIERTTGWAWTEEIHTETCPKCNGGGEFYPKYTPATAMLDVNEAAKGNIYMHEEYDDAGQLKAEGDNAWRGADYYSEELMPLIRAYLEQSSKNADLHYDLERKKKEASV